MVNINSMFIGDKCNYGKVFSDQTVLKRYYEILKSWGIKKVINDRTPRTKNSLIYSHMTLLILPKILDIDIIEKQSKTVSLEDQQIIIHSNYDILDSSCVRIKYNDNIIADYYIKRNLIILYYNPFPYEARIRKFQKNIDLIKRYISILNDYDNSEEMKLMFIKKNISKFSKRIKETKIKTISEIESYYDNVNVLSRKIIVAHQDIRVKIEINKMLTKMLNNFGVEFEKSIDEIRELPFIDKVLITNKGIELYYNNINIIIKEKIYEIGDMRALITPISVFLYNKNKTSDEYQHPHVYKDGTPCLGSFSNDISELLGRLQLKKLAILLRQFLTTYNPKSPVNKISYWKYKIDK